MPDVTVSITSASAGVGIASPSATIKAVGEVVLTLDTTRFKFYQIPTPVPDGAKVAFTIAEAFVAGSLTVYRDQLALQGDSVDFEETDPDEGTFLMTAAPDADEIVWCNYIKQ